MKLLGSYASRASARGCNKAEARGTPKLERDIAREGGRMCAQHTKGENAPFRMGDDQRQLARPVMHLGNMFK